MNTVLLVQSGISVSGIFSILLLFRDISSSAFSSIARKISAESEISLPPTLIFTLQLVRKRSSHMPWTESFSNCFSSFTYCYRFTSMGFFLVNGISFPWVLSSSVFRIAFKSIFAVKFRSFFIDIQIHPFSFQTVGFCRIRLEFIFINHAVVLRRKHQTNK